MEIKIINKSDNALPARGSNWAAGMDIRADLDAPVVIAAYSTRAIPTGLYTEVPNGFAIEITPRSGLALNECVTVHNSPGLVDADYRGEIKVILYNGSPTMRMITHGQRIAQLRVVPIIPIDWVEVDELEDSERGENGFGSTGKK